MHTDDTTPAAFWPPDPDDGSPVVPVEDAPGSLVDQLSAIVHFCTRTDPTQPEADRWARSRHLCLPHVVDPPAEGL